MPKRATYRRLLDHLHPDELLGLTATPERGDGVDVRALFDGRIAAELRLWDALGADLLCPFHYFAVADNVDLRSVSWTRGRYDEDELANLYTGNHARAAIVLAQLRDKVLDPGGMRALGFCVSTDHAKFMTQVFNDAGLVARTVLGETSQVDREQALRDLRSGDVQILFTVDVFNEGLDVPDVDTVLFLRPTESATIFLQQLGRGLRRTRDKAVLTVLDFVGHHRKEFRFDLKLRALTGQSRRELERDIERGFPFLPSGCQIVMDRQAQQVVLENIRGQVANRWKDLVQELRRLPDVNLQAYLDETGVELSDVLRQGQKSWTQLRRDAGLVTHATVGTRVSTPQAHARLRPRRRRHPCRGLSPVAGLQHVVRRPCCRRPATRTHDVLLAAPGCRRIRLVRRRPASAQETSRSSWTSLMPSSSAGSTTPATCQAASVAASRTCR